MMRLSDQICSLLRRSHRPLVKVIDSTIPGAGNGLTVLQDISNKEGGDTVMCLYPGVYSPGLPLNLVYPSSLDGDISSDFVYLGDQLTPSGLMAQANAYILNLQETGGYLDGSCLSVKYATNKKEIALLENPSSYGHYVNHSSTKANVHFVAFRWKDVLGDGIQKNHESHFDLPNTIRNDRAAWYLDQRDGSIVYYNGDGNNNLLVAGCLEQPQVNVCGAAIVSQRDISAGEELLMNYNLQSPFPLWAQGWYE